MMPTFEEVARERKWLTDESAIRKQISKRTGNLPDADVEIIESWVIADLWSRWPTIKKLKPFIRKSVGFKIYEFRRLKLREGLATGRDAHGNPIPGESEIKSLYFDPTPGGEDIDFVETLADTPGPEDEIEKQMPEIRAGLADTFGSLPDEQREIAVLVLVEELPLNVAAKRLGLTTTTASSRLYRAKQSLRAGALRDVAEDWHMMVGDRQALGSDWVGVDGRIGKTKAQYQENRPFSKFLDGVRV